MIPSARPTTPLVYVECDIPEGVTLVEWRRRRHQPDRHRLRIVGALRRMPGLPR